ncbi:MAG: hypothetical protein ACP5OC_08095 [Thermoplasmata archaeon]
MIRTSTLDDFTIRPLTARTSRFMKLCSLYRSIKGEYPESGFLVYEFIHEIKLPFELRHFKLLSERQVITAFWKWQRISGMFPESD